MLIFNIIVFIKYLSNVLAKFQIDESKHFSYLSIDLHAAIKDITELQVTEVTDQTFA